MKSAVSRIHTTRDEKRMKGILPESVPTMDIELNVATTRVPTGPVTNQTQSALLGYAPTEMVVEEVMVDEPGQAFVRIRRTRK